MNSRTMRKYVPRITVEVTEEQYSALKYHLEHGMMKRVFSSMIDDAIVMLDQYGQHFIVALLQKDVTYGPFMEKYMERNYGDTR